MSTRDNNSAKRQPSLRFGFTLIELLVVVSIIALLVSILLPALSKARMQARRVVCSANLQQCGVAWYMYADDNRDFFPINYAEDSQGRTTDKLSFGNWTVLVDKLHDELETGKYGIAKGGGNAFYCPNYEQVWKVTPAHSWNSANTAKDTTIDGISWSCQFYRTSYVLYGAHYYARLYGPKEYPPPTKVTDKNLSFIPMIMDDTHWYGPAYEDHGFSYSAHFQGGTGTTFFRSGRKNYPNPAGGNSLFGDGHVEWRRFENMVPIFTTNDFIRYF